MRPVTAPAEAEDRSGFFGRNLPRLNPTRWFGGRRDRSEEPPPTLLDAPAAPATNAAPVPSARADNPPPEPAFPRYTYRGPAAPAPGDRAAAQRLFAAGVAEQRAGRPQQAVDRYREAAGADPAFFDVHYNAAIAAFEAGDLPAALSASELALALQPAAAEARYNFALALDRAGHPVDAAVQLEKLLQQQPDAANAHLLLANLYAQQLRRPADARLHYRRVLELEPDHPQSAAIGRWLATAP
jgi:tetratricopeptide (TPR) repeat protein